MGISKQLRRLQRKAIASGITARFMAWHVKYFRAYPKEKGRSDLIEEASELSVENALLVFISFEKSDTSNPVEIVDRTANELLKICATLGLRTIVLNPFAHLFGDLANTQDASKMLNSLYAKLKERNFEVYKLAFGIFYEIELKAEGHRLSRISRIISA
ncbi:MAG: threonyl-tRNA synthetase editing domain-containing protein [Candidatus Micrarchaeaceae archaeon]